MKPPEQFLAEYFHERTALYETKSELLAPLHQKFFAHDCPSGLLSEDVVEKSRSERILSVSQSDGKTLVVTNGMSGANWPLRYHLRSSGDSWRIHKVEWECLGCHAAGKLRDEVCFLCEGKGWQSNAA